MKRMIALSVIMHLYACGKGGNTSQLNITASAAADLCRSDVLTRRAAVGRVEWAFRCGLIKGDADASAEALKKSYLFKSDGTPRSVVSYPTFTAQDGKLFIAPTNAEEECSVLPAGTTSPVNCESFKMPFRFSYDYLRSLASTTAPGSCTSNRRQAMDTLNYALDSAIISSNVYNWLLYGSGNEGRMVPILDGKYGIGTEIIGVCPLPP